MNVTLEKGPYACWKTKSKIEISRDKIMNKWILMSDVFPFAYGWPLDYQQPCTKYEQSTIGYSFKTCSFLVWLNDWLLCGIQKWCWFTVLFNIFVWFYHGRNIKVILLSLLYKSCDRDDSMFELIPNPFKPKGNCHSHQWGPRRVF